MLGGAGKLLAQVGKKSVDSNGNQKKVMDNDPFVGQIEMVGFNFAPVGWALCDGSLIAISTNEALFSLLGTTFGGNGINTFGLPDLRGRFPLGMGQGNGLTDRPIGEESGEENHTLISSEMPIHTHQVEASTSNGTSSTPSGNYPAVNNEGIQHYATTANGTMSASMLTSAGSSQSHNNMPPFLAVNFIIATSGIFPARS